MKTKNQKTVHGFALIEALVAMMIVSFGMLGIVGFQTTLSLNSDVAKQRTEATRLAQEKLEDLRTFSDLKTDLVTPEPDPAVSYPKKIINGTKTISPSTDNLTNTTYTLSWKVLTQNPDTGRSINVVVTWNDRAGNEQKVQLLSHISASDPVLTGSLFFAPSNGKTIRRPKNRDINVPYPAVAIDGNRSAFKPAGSSGALIVFDNVTGDVKGKCTNMALPTAGGTVNLASEGCDTLEGYLLSGYVRFCTSNDCNVSPNDNNDVGAKYAKAADPTFALNSSTPLQIDSSNQTPGSPTLICYSAQEVILNNNTNALDTGQANNDIKERFISYVCIVYPVDHDSNEQTDKIWSGRVTLNPSNTWTIANGNSNYKVCRFTADYDLSGGMSNNEHPLWYRGVTHALDNQNYLVIPANGACPNDKPTNPSAEDFVNANTATHQTSGSTGGELSFTCNAINNQMVCSNSVVIEPATLNEALPTQ